MEVWRDVGSGAAPAGTAVTVGVYDGVHLGHRLLIETTRAAARDRGLPSVVVTFDPHPATVVRPSSAPGLLCDLEQRLELLAAAGVDLTVVVPFDRARSEEPAEDFVAEILVRAVKARVVIVGQDFHFGHGRKGDVELLRRMGEDVGFEVEGIGLVGDAGGAVSSTRIRDLLRAGDMAGAAAMLGHPHELRGRVVQGRHRGGPELGYPTANVEVPPGILLPAEGVYAAWYLRPDGSARRAAASLGRRPTFYGPRAPVVLEAHLLDFDGDLYGEQARVRLVSRLREERRFDDAAQLVAQMGSDVAAARRVL